MKFLLLAALLGAAFADDSYVVVAPSKVRPGMDFSVSVNILKATADVTVSASMVRTNDGTTVSTNIATLQQGVPSTVDLQMPKVLQSGTYELRVSGTGGLVFSNKTHIAFNSKDKSVLIQTDKAMYKPGQTVNFRVLAVYPDLSLYRGLLDIEIFDKNSNKIKQWKQVSAAEGVITQLLSLSSQPVLGDWKIKVTAGNSVEQKTFTVAEYVLPKFEVTVELPSYVLESASSVPVTVKAKYTYGKPVIGPVVVEAKLVRSYYHGTLPTVQRTGQLDAQGKAVITFPYTELKTLNRYLNNQKIKFSANVTESLTGITLNGSDTVQIYSQSVKLEFPSSNPNTFKPGLAYNGYLKVSQPDGLPVVAAAGKRVSITTTVTTELPHTGTTIRYYYPRTTTYKLPAITAALSDNGLVPLQLSVPANATSINVKAEFGGVHAYSTISKSYSPSNNYIQLFLRSTTQLQAGGRMSFEFKATEAVQTLVYQVLSRGSIVAAGKISAGGASSKVFSLDVTSSMAPNARIVTYYVRADGEIVADSISFDVDGAFQNQVSINLSTNEAQPADNVSVIVRADPQSTVHLLAVDQSVLLLKSGNDITAGQVVNELKSYDTTKNSNPGIIPFGGFGGGPVPLARAKRMIWFPYPVYYGGSDANQIFKNAGVVVMTDALVYHYVKPYRPYRFSMFNRVMAFGGGPAMPQAAFMRPLAMAGSSAMGFGGGMLTGGLQEVERVRNVFPETWLWTSATVSADGSATVATTVPDTITSWVTSAFAVNPTTGLGVAPVSAKLRVFRPFFVTLNLPYSVTRGEQVVIQAIVFNYMDSAQNVRVSMAQSQDYANVVIDATGAEDLRHEDQVQNVQVAAGEGKSVFFPVVPTKLGNVEVVVSAQSTRAADAVRRQLLVEPEGVPKEFGVSVLVDLKDTTTFTKTVPISLPPNVVVDSSRARVTAVGDLMGPTVSGLDKLLKMPTGCGEQNMIGMAPDVFVTKYLKTTNQLAGDIADKAIKFMEHGYQRELTYQHKDGSFSAFGDRDPSGSMWLTAFVAKTFHQAKPYIFIDDDVITRAIDWMITKQDSDGSFPEPGRVIHKNMQGGASNGTGLTAFVLISLLENNDLQGSISQRVETAKTKAISYLKGKLTTLNNDDYILSMVTYALTLAGDNGATSAFNTLLGHAVTKDGQRYWHKPTPRSTSSNTRYWRPPTAASSDVEMTSYALLTYAANQNFVGGLDVMKWVASQRNPNGGYASTQDTILALQALSEFASLAYSENFNIDVSVDTGDFFKHFSVRKENALVLQSADLPTVPSSVTVSATGSGIALVEIGVFFNVEQEVEEPSFNVKVNLIQDTMNLLEIETCAHWLETGASGMAVQEVGIPSGFEVDAESVKKHDVLKRVELEDRKVVLYFDEIGATPVCTRMIAQRTGLVAKSKPVGVRVYDYYEPENQATAFYESQVLKNSSVCDVCADCACPAVKGR